LYVDFLSSIINICLVKKDILKRFGLKIKELRLKNEWSQEMLAEKTGFHRTYIGMVERGERNLSLKNVEIFANVFSLSISKLLEI
jgi:transcriptional regulator with XRE-family HTH domain